MNTQDMVFNILQLPQKLKDSADASIYSLLKEVDYFDKHAAISEPTIQEALAAHPNLAEEWLIYSEDKRTDKGWYIKKVDDTKYVVDYFPTSGTTPLKKEYVSLIDACATFIKNELEAIRLQ